MGSLLFSWGNGQNRVYLGVSYKIGHIIVSTFTCGKVLLHRAQPVKTCLVVSLRRLYGPCDTPSSLIFFFTHE